MDITTQLQNGQFSVTMKGTFTFNDNPAFRDVLERIADDAVQQITFHMQGVEFVDSAALGMLLLARDAASKHQKYLVLSGARGQVAKMFTVARFDTIFTLVDMAKAS